MKNNFSTLMRLEKGDVSLEDRTRDLVLHQASLLGFVLPAFSQRPGIAAAWYDHPKSGP